MRVRLPKFISRAGLSSRRTAEEWIREGRVTVNGRVVRDPGTPVDPDADHVKVDGRLIGSGPSHIYLLLNKPRGVVTTLRDPEGRPTVADLIKGVKARLFPVGRLDFQTEGLLLLTNDGELAHRLMHPRYGLERVYRVKVKGIPTRDVLQGLWRGVQIEPGLRVRAQAKFIRALKANAWLEMTLKEGRHREIRRMCEAVGHPVLALRRVRFGPLTLEGLPPGRYRALTVEEIRGLQRSVGRIETRHRRREYLDIPKDAG